MCKQMNTHSYNTNRYAYMYISCLVSPSLIVPVVDLDANLAARLISLQPVRKAAWRVGAQAGIQSVWRVCVLSIYTYHMNHIIYTYMHICVCIF